MLFAHLERIMKLDRLRLRVCSSRLSERDDLSETREASP